MATIKQEDFIASVADALQFMSYYHPEDYIEALGEAYKAEQSAADIETLRRLYSDATNLAS